MAVVVVQTRIATMTTATTQVLTTKRMTKMMTKTTRPTCEASVLPRWSIQQLATMHAPLPLLPLHASADRQSWCVSAT